ncbi:MAG: hypothetical protein Q7T33_06075 [Dehalococcoidia bacterium]|nr:hypothetical protein [Dehalococcoidia bacterium]
MSDHEARIRDVVWQHILAVTDPGADPRTEFSHGLIIGITLSGSDPDLAKRVLHALILDKHLQITAKADQFAAALRQTLGLNPEDQSQ